MAVCLFGSLFVVPSGGLVAVGMKTAARVDLAPLTRPECQFREGALYRCFPSFTLHRNCTSTISFHISALSGNNKHQEKYGNYPRSKGALFHVLFPDVLSAVRRRSVHILHYGYSYTAVSAPGEFISIITCAITVEYSFQDIWGSCPFTCVMLMTRRLGGQILKI